MGVSICEYVRDGNTFMTSEKVWIRLAEVCAPAEGEFGFAKAMELLEELILDKTIVYHAMGPSRGNMVAEVWVGSTNVNSYMRGKGYTCH